MKKTILIIVGVILLLTIIGVWVYFFLFYTPTEDGVYAQLATDTTVVPTASTTTPSTTSASSTPSQFAPEALKKITSRPTAGAVLVEGGVRYVEKGTGHIYETSFDVWKESPVTNTTIPNVTEAVFSPDGNRVALTSISGNSETLFVGTIEQTDEELWQVTGIELPDEAREVAFSETGEVVYYLLDTTSGSAGYQYSIASGMSSRVFSIPFRDITILWGDDIFVYTKPSSEQNGAVYRVVDTTLIYITAAAPGLMATQYSEGILVSTTNDSTLTSIGYEGGEQYQLPLALFPDKCVGVPADTSVLYCAAEAALSAGEYPDDWYKGTVSFSDSLWSVTVSESTTELLSDLAKSAHQPIDTAAIGTDETGKYIYLINKRDGALWVFDTTL